MSRQPSAAFHTDGAASAWFATKKTGDYGKNVSRFDIYYLEQPAGGDAYLVVPGLPTETLSTRGPKKVSRIKSVSLPDGPGQLSIRTVGNGDVRMFGVALERDQPGVVYDALGANGARIRLWDAMKESHWADQLDLRQPSLIILEYGTNESEDDDFRLETYEPALDRVLTKIEQDSVRAADRRTQRRATMPWWKPRRRPRQPITWRSGTPSRRWAAKGRWPSG